MSKEIVTTDQINSLATVAKYAANSKLFEKLGGEAAAFCVAMYALELGLPIMPCLFGGIKPVAGNIEIAPRMMNAMIRKAGHKIEILELTDQKCTLKGTRHDTKESYTCSFSIDDARKAGLIRSGGGYDKWTSDMLFARALSRLARRLFADVISTAYIEGEISQGQEPTAKGDIEIKHEIVTENKVVEKPDEFVAFHNTLCGIVNQPYRSDVLKEYVQFLEVDRKTPASKIMEQALRKELVERFARGFEAWADAKADTESLEDQSKS